MLTVTDAAGTLLATMLNERGLPPEVGVRFVEDGEAIGLQQDNQRPGDQTFEHEGRTVLLLDEPMANRLTDETLDAQGDKLTLRPSSEQG